MFIVVRFGDDCKEVFNADCKNAALIAMIKKRCRCKDDEIIELSDERGQVKQMMEHIQENGTKFFRDREAVILLRVERKEYTAENEEDEHDLYYYFYTPKLKALESNQAFLSKLNPTHREAKKKTKRKKDEQPTKSSSHQPSSQPIQMSSADKQKKLSAINLNKGPSNGKKLATKA